MEPHKIGGQMDPRGMGGLTVARGMGGQMDSREAARSSLVGHRDEYIRPFPSQYEGEDGLGTRQNPHESKK